MRDIEFRAKRQDNKKWVYGDLVHNTLTMSICIPSPAQAGARRFYKINPKTVGQYIGLKDNNEQKVFEGDIMQDSYDPDEIYIVSFMDGEFVLINDVNVIMDIEQVHFLSVIGNIHDNKEFFKSED